MRYSYRVRYSEDEDVVVYRKFHYTPRQLGVRGFLATVCAAIAIFLLIPLPDELFIIPPMVAGLRSLLPVDIHVATFYAYAIYKSIGLLFLAVALILGAEYARDMLFSRVRQMHKSGKELQNHIQKTHTKLKEFGSKRSKQKR